MLTRRTFIVLTASASVARAAGAAEEKRPARIAFLGSGRAHLWVKPMDAFRAGLGDLGYREGKTAKFAFRWADGNEAKLPQLAGELLKFEPDVLVTYGTAGTRAAKQATAAIPIVMATSADAVGAGLVADLARPGGNVTGSTVLLAPIYAKRLQVLKEAVPMTRVAVVTDAAGGANVAKALHDVAEPLGLRLELVEVSGPAALGAAVRRLEKTAVDAVALAADRLAADELRPIALDLQDKRLPAIGPRDFAEIGGLLGYGADMQAQFRRAAYFVDRILDGTKPADLPVEQPDKFDLVVNTGTAKAIGLTLPQSFLTLADRVIS